MDSGYLSQPKAVEFATEGGLTPGQRPAAVMHLPCLVYCLLTACLQVDPGYLSQPKAVEFATEGGLTAYMNYYPPANKVGGVGGGLG